MSRENSALNEGEEIGEFRGIDAPLSRIGGRVETYLQTAGDGRKYFTEVILRVPLIFVIHQWILLSPTSDYWIIDILMFIVKHCGEFEMFTVTR